MTETSSEALPRPSSAWKQTSVVLLAGVCAALHVGKLSPAVTALQQALGMSLVEAGFLLSLVQLAGMAAGIAVGTLADGFGLRRSMTLGLVILAVASAAGAMVDGVLPLLLLRALESLGFLLTVLSGPGLLRRLLPIDRVQAAMGLWGSYMPVGVALALLTGTAWIDAFGWRSWWLLTGAASAVVALLLWRVVPEPAPSAAAGVRLWATRVKRTLSNRGPWLVAATFAAYSSQWLAVIGFLPVIYEQMGVGRAEAGVLSALAAGMNAVGNVAGGFWMQRGLRPTTLVAVGFVCMAVTAALAFAAPEGSGLSVTWRYAAILMFSGAGGVIPASLFALVVRLTPAADSSTAVGWVQQWSAMGQFAGPPLVSWIASRAGGWHWTWVVTSALAMAGLALAWFIGRLAAARIRS
jgi:CP family cyanate transporter-like MFS transporter